MTGRFLWWLWQLPQISLGALVRLVRRGAHRKRIGDARVYFVFRTMGGLSLGPLVFVHSRAGADLIRHELGHCAQSRLLGPAYLPVVGLPSLLWAVAHARLARGVPYDWFFTERWATRLGASIDVTDATDPVG